MASILKVDTLTGVTTAGSISVTGEGNSTTTNLQQGLAKSWCNFDGTAGSVSFSDSFNKSSITDDGTGAFTTAFTNTMGNATYTELPASSFFSGIWNSAEMTTGDCKIFTSNASGTNVDRDPTVTATLGDLA